MKSAFILPSFLILFALLLTDARATEGVIKRSTSGFCHPPHSPWYDRTQNYEPFETVKACLEAAGRLPAGISTGSLGNAIKPSEAASEGLEGYQRSAFGHGWDDANNDCRNSRAEALVASSTTHVQFSTDTGCRVVTGRWVSAFTGKVIQNASDIDIDHVVPLAWSWSRGARDWSDERRLRFANDPANLLPVEATLNRSKGAKGPDQWLPPKGRCGYVARFARVVRVYDLQPLPHETAWFQSFLDKCRSFSSD
ncbi:uncharacterized protein DUF1524 [Marinobacter nauticus]|nr:uncharacterized protein DUF1524 [Marinobacter nauticus]